MVEKKGLVEEQERPPSPLSNEDLSLSTPTPQGDLPTGYEPAPQSSTQAATENLKKILSQDPFLGQIIHNFLLKKRIGEGGFGRVYQAEHTELGTICAFKILTLQDHEDPRVVEQAIQRFRREARMLAQIRQENIVQVTDFGLLADKYYYLAMEYIEGEPLLRYKKKHGAFSIARIKEITGQLCKALAYIHERGIVHRDLKPSNILLVPRTDGSLHTKIIDFGIASLADDLSLTQTGSYLGSPMYMSPEQSDGRPHENDGRSDLYTLGIILHQLLTGTVPFQSDHFAGMLRLHLLTPPPLLSDKKPDRPWAPSLEEALQSLLAKKPEMRPQTAQIAWEILSRAFDDQASLERKDAPTPPFSPSFSSTSNAFLTLPSTSGPPQGPYAQLLSPDWEGAPNTPYPSQPPLSASFDPLEASPHVLPSGFNKGPLIALTTAFALLSLFGLVWLLLPPRSTSLPPPPSRSLASSPSSGSSAPLPPQPSSPLQPPSAPGLPLPGREGAAPSRSSPSPGNPGERGSLFEEKHAPFASKTDERKTPPEPSRDFFEKSPSPFPPSTPPPSAPPSKISFALFSIPKGAEVWQGTQLLGKTPFKYEGKSGEVMTVTLRLTGYKDFSFSKRLPPSPSQAILRLKKPVKSSSYDIDPLAPLDR